MAGLHKPHHVEIIAARLLTSLVLRMELKCHISCCKTPLNRQAHLTFRAQLAHYHLIGFFMEFISNTKGRLFKRGLS